MQLAERRNVQPLPDLKKGFGLRLPPEEDCLLGAKYQLARGPASSAPAEPMDVDGRCILCSAETPLCFCFSRAAFDDFAGGCGSSTQP